MNITIGSDPEYVIVEDGTIKEASTVLRECEFYDGYEIGEDCGGGEFRPEYGNTPLEHRDNLEILINKVKEFVPERFTLLAGTAPHKFALGGHIHIGMPIKCNERYIHHNDFARYFSYFCGIPLRKIEKTKDLEYRGMKTNSYGYFGAFDIKSFGIELRMPASWLVSKEIATSALCLAHVVSNEWNINPIDVINPNNNTRDEDKYKSLITGNVSEILESVEKMEEFLLYKGEIGFLFDMISNDEKWKCEEDFRTFL